MITRTDILSKIKETAQEILPTHSRLVLFGSQARGDARPDSDWDLLLLLDKERTGAEDFDRFAFPFVDLGWTFGQYFSPKVYSFAEWEARSGSPFYKNVNKDGIVIWN